MSEDSIPKDYDEYELDMEIDLSKLPVMPRGRFAPQGKGQTNVVVLAPDVAGAFPDAESVNAALRLVIQMAKLAHLQPHGSD